MSKTAQAKVVAQEKERVRKEEEDRLGFYEGLRRDRTPPYVIEGLTGQTLSPQHLLLHVKVRSVCVVLACAVIVCAALAAAR
jgi:hypothetical protein